MVAVLAGSLLACSPKSTALTGTRHLEQNRTGDIQKVLVVGISPNGPVRNRFEQEVKKQLGKHKIDAVGSLEVLPKEEAINKEAFVKYFNDQQIDAVLVTRVVSAENTAGFVEGEDYTNPQNMWIYNYYSYYYRTYDKAADVGHFEYGEVVKLETNVFNVENEKLIWQGESKSFLHGNTLDIIDELSKLLVQGMKKDGLID